MCSTDIGLLADPRNRVKLFGDLPYLVHHSLISVSNGTKAAERACGYAEDARIPRGRWSHATTESLSEMFDAGDWEAGRSVCLSAVSEKSLAEIREIVELLGQLGSADAGFSECVEVMISILKRHLRFEKPIIYHGVARDEPGLVTTSIDTASSQYVGLHVDNWDDLPLARRDDALNRVSLNVGSRPRAFLFMPVRASQMEAAVTAAGQPLHRSGPSGRQFMATFPGFPVVRAILRPGWFYVAPTDNLIHDGSTEGDDMVGDMGGESVVLRAVISPQRLGPGASSGVAAAPS